MGILRLPLGFFILSVLAGCAGLNKEHVQFEGLSDCPPSTAAKLLAKQNGLGSLSDTHTLACALDFMRNSNDPALRRSALGSKLCLNLAERETDQDRREELAAEGVSFAETAIGKGGDGNGAVHYYLSANLGLAVREHLSLAMENLARLEKEMKRAVALSPGYDQGGPLRLLGMLYLKAPAWPNGIGDPDKGLELLETAVKEYPSHPMNHLFLAQAILQINDADAVGRAKSEFALGERLLMEGKWGYSEQAWQKEFVNFRPELGD